MLSYLLKDPPFADVSWKMRVNNIKNCNYSFNPVYWDGVSSSAKNLIRSLLVVDPKKRLSTADGTVGIVHSILCGFYFMNILFFHLLALRTSWFRLDVYVLKRHSLSGSQKSLREIFVVG